MNTKFKIYIPAKSSMQSGLNNTSKWCLEPSNISDKIHSSSFGWVSSNNPIEQIKLFFNDLNVDVIGMTNMPEAKLAREAEIRYASVGMITDYDCWNHEYQIASVDSILSIMKQNTDKVNYFLKYLLENFYTDKLIDDSTCRCLDKSIVTKISNIDKKDLRKLENILKRYIKENAK